MSGKHVVISCEGGDFSMDLIFAGLVRRFGKENVIDYPPRAKYRQGKPKLVGDNEKDYGAERRSLCYVEGCEDLKEYTYQEVLDWVDSHRCADLHHKQAMIWMDETNESFVYLTKLIRMSSHKPKVNIIAGHDKFRGDPFEIFSKIPDWLVQNAMRWEDNIGRGLPNGHTYNLFIDDWQPEYDKLHNTHLINLSCNFDHLWDVERRDEFRRNKIYDICFIGYNSNPIRKIVIDHIKNKWGHLNNYIIFEERRDKFDKFIRHDEMFKIIAQSKICLNLPGASTGGRALRYYEIPYVGSWMISQKFPAKLLYPMSHWKFETREELDLCIKNSLDYPHAREKFADDLHKHCMKFHTIDARMDYIFKVLDEQKTTL